MAEKLTKGDRVQVLSTGETVEVLERHGSSRKLTVRAEDGSVFQVSRSATRRI